MNVATTVQDPHGGKEEGDIPIVIEKATALLAIEVEAARHILEALRITLLSSRASQ
jgi:hypothetical protein